MGVMMQEGGAGQVRDPAAIDDALERYRPYPRETKEIWRRLQRYRETLPEWCAI
eukprot:COSAG05_NODE_731_length_7667_cov_140.831792_3_plen_54_part_00